MSGQRQAQLGKSNKGGGSEDPHKRVANGQDELMNRGLALAENGARKAHNIGWSEGLSWVGEVEGLRHGGSDRRHWEGRVTPPSNKEAS